MSCAKCRWPVFFSRAKEGKGEKKEGEGGECGRKGRARMERGRGNREKR